MIQHRMKSFFGGLLGAALMVATGALPATPAHAAYQFLDDKAEPQVSVTATVKSAGTGSLSLVFDYRDAENYYALDCAPGSAALRAVVSGKERRLAGAAVKWEPSSQITLKRRPWVMQVIVDRRVLLTAYDASFNSGKIGSTATGGWAWQDVRVQPVEELYFADDFTRAEGQEGEWKIATGQWQLTSSSENINTRNVSMSANPFSYQVAMPTGTAFTQAGRWFWDNYHAEVSVRPAGRGTVGLAVYVQNAQNYLAFLWDANAGDSARRLVRVVNGRATVIATAPGGFLPRQWYRIGVRTSPGYVEAFLDGTQVLKARDDWFGQGGIGLIAEKATLVAFDDVRVQSYSFYRQDFNGPVDASWAPEGGRWAAQNDTVASAPKPGDGGATRFLVTGGDNWNGYQFTASAKAGESGACGIVVGYQDNNNYSVFRWAGPRSGLAYRGRQQLMRYFEGKAKIISDEPSKMAAVSDSSGFARVTLRLNPGALTVMAGGEPIAQVAQETLGGGRVALWAQGVQPVSFRDVVVFFPPEPIAPKVPPKMEDDALMVGWASPSGEWPPTFGDNGTEYWNTGEFFGDAAVEMIWRRTTYAQKHGKLELALRAKRGEFGSGYIVRCESTADRNGGLKVSLLHGNDVLKQTQFDWKQLEAAEDKNNSDAAAGGAVPVRVELEGQAVMLIVGGKPAMSYVNPDPAKAPTGTAIAARTSGFQLRTKELVAVNAHRDDYTFTEAPTDWYTPSGTWSVISRWPCYSDWSFFGGKGLNPSLWSKRTYRGDTVVEMYAHNQMDLPKEIGYSHPGDLNITIGGDGKNPSSGYSFVVAGWDNTRSSILRGTQVVAVNNTEDGRFAKPINHYMPFHRRWFYIRAEARRATKDGRNGVHVALTVDDVPLCEYFDPDPLGTFERGGHVAMWSVDGTLMIARAKIESEVMGSRTLPADLVDAENQPALPAAPAGELAPKALLSDGLPSAVIERAAGAEPAWTLRNPTSGGLFAVQFVKPGETAAQPWQATPNTKLNLDVALPKEVKVDLYVTLERDGNDVQHMIAITNDQKPDARVQLLGTVHPETEAGGWQHISFDLVPH